MKSLVVYDSQFGNTQKIAEAIGQGLLGEVKVRRAADTLPEDIAGVNVLVIGSPTQGGRATQTIQAFIDAIPLEALKNLKVATFDTRFNEASRNFGLRLLMRTIKYAAEKMAKSIEMKGGQLIGKPEAFFVIDKQGPLAEGEAERAKAWGAGLVK